MSSADRKRVDALLSKVAPSRRKFLERVILGGGVAALMALPSSTLLAQEPEPQQGKGKGEGKGDGDAEGRGRGKGKGKGDGRGRGKGKGKGRGKGKGDQPDA